MLTELKVGEQYETACGIIVYIESKINAGAGFIGKARKTDPVKTYYYTAIGRCVSGDGIDHCTAQLDIVRHVDMTANLETQSKRSSATRAGIMQAFAEGIKIERIVKTSGKKWELVSIPNWDWNCNEYRIVRTPPSIDWAIFQDEIKFIYVDSTEIAYASTERPLVGSHAMTGNGKFLPLEFIRSFERGNLPWSQSIVERPKA